MGGRLLVADRVAGAAEGANAILVDGADVTAVGTHHDLVGAAGEVVSYDGATLMAGLRDAHLHPVPYTALLGGANLKTARSLAEVADRLRGAAARSPGPVVAMRLDDEALADRRLPTREDLDAAVADRPVLVHRVCGHIAVANSAALALAGIDTATPDPEGGIIDRGEAGVPTGVLRETAIEIASRALAGTAQVAEDDVLAALGGLTSLGLTSIGAMVRTGDGPWASLGDEVELLASIAGRVPLRIHGFTIADDEAELSYGRRLLTGAGPLVRWAGLKRFADGGLGGHTAAMSEPFADEPTNRGTLRLGGHDEDLARACLAAGGAVAIHAIGDLACSRVIDLFERVGAPKGRVRLEHASVITREDVARMARLGVVACVQPSFLGSESGWLEARVGPDRMALTYPFASMQAAGVVLAGGSDCPVETPDPWSGMALARDRAGLVPEERLDAASALDLFTAGAARALGEQPPLRPGSPADVIAVDRDPLTSTPDELRATRVEAVWIAGTELEIDASAVTWPE
jgi:hypothetical protein